MTIESEEGSNFLSAFKSAFAVPERTEKRRKAERVAGLTPGQRARRGPPKTQMNIRVTTETKAQVATLTAKTGLTMTDVIARAVQEMHDREERGTK